MSCHTERFKYSAKVSHNKYGICNFAANGSVFWKDRILAITKSHSISNHTAAKP